MRFLIDNGAYSLQNLGDVAMLQTLVRRLLKLDPGAVVRVLTQDADRLRRFCPQAEPVATDLKGAWLESTNLVGPWRRLVPAPWRAGLSRLERAFRSRWPDRALGRMRRRFGPDSDRVHKAEALREEVRAADWVLASGGGYINDAFRNHANGVLDILALAQSEGRRTGMLGQGLGPMDEPGLRRTAARVIPRLEILAVRESADSLPLAALLGRPSASTAVTGDDAIELAHDRTPPALGDRLGLNVRIATYSGITPEVLAAIGEVIRRTAAARPRTVEYLPISLTEDWTHRADIVSALGVAVEYCRSAGPEPDVDDVIDGVGRCRIVLTASYHTAVFALSQGVSVVALIASDYYRSKLGGVGQAFGTGLHLVDLRRPGWPSELATALGQADEQAPALHAHLLKAARVQIDSGWRTYERMLDKGPRPEMSHA